MSYYTTANPPAQAFEAIEAIRDLIAADATLTAAIGGAGYVYEHRVSEPPGGQWKRVVVRQPVFGEGSRVNVSRTQGVRIDVMVEVQEQVEKPDTFLAQAHELIFAAIVGQTLTLTRGAQIGHVQPYQTATAAAYDEGDHSFYSTAGYIVAMMPA